MTVEQCTHIAQCAFVRSSERMTKRTYASYTGFKKIEKLDKYNPSNLRNCRDHICIVKSRDEDPLDC